VTKVLFRIHSLEVGGAERALINLLNALDYTKFEVTLLCEATGTLDDTLPQEVIKKTVFKGNKELSNRGPIYKNIYRLYRRILFTVIRMFPDVLYGLGILNKYDVEIAAVQDLVPFTICRIFRFNKNSRRIAWIHTDLGRKDYHAGMRSQIIRNLHRYDSIIVVSPQVAKSILDNDKSLESKIIVLPNVVSKEKIISRSLAPIEIEKPPVTTIVALGRLEKVKGFERLISCCRKLKDESIKFRLLIVGDGVERTALAQKIQQEGLSEEVTLVGFRENPYPFIRLADIFVLSSYYEGYPMVVTEALVLEKVILSTNVSGVQEMLKQGLYGYIVDNNTESIYSGLRDLILKDDLRVKYSVAAKEGSKQFDGNAVVRRFESLVQELVQLGRMTS
jgi:glycosyltransferase involved in cell wall biosynthesis